MKIHQIPPKLFHKDLVVHYYSYTFRGIIYGKIISISKNTQISIFKPGYLTRLNIAWCYEGEIIEAYISNTTDYDYNMCSKQFFKKRPKWL